MDEMLFNKAEAITQRLLAIGTFPDHYAKRVKEEIYSTLLEDSSNSVLEDSEDSEDLC